MGYLLSGFGYPVDTMSSVIVGLLFGFILNSSGLFWVVMGCLVVGVLFLRFDSCLVLAALAAVRFSFAYLFCPLKKVI